MLLSCFSEIKHLLTSLMRGALTCRLNNYCTRVGRVVCVVKLLLRNEVFPYFTEGGH